MLRFRENFLRFSFIVRRFQHIGTDSFGNAYYEKPSKASLRKTRRFVLYKGPIEASCVPPLWHAWLHFMIQDPPSSHEKSAFWQKNPSPNLTGTLFAYFPKIIQKDPFPSSYIPWKPTKEHL